MVAARALVFFVFIVTGMVVGRSLPRSEAAEPWEAEWDKTVKAAEEEGQVSLYIAGYEKVIDSGEFQKAYPKIKVISVTGSGTQLSKRIAAEGGPRNISPMSTTGAATRFTRCSS